jgi:hypothetical protein
MDDADQRGRLTGFEMQGDGEPERGANSPGPPLKISPKGVSRAQGGYLTSGVAGSACR